MNGIASASEAPASYFLADGRIEVSIENLVVRADERVLNNIAKFEFKVLSALAEKPDTLLEEHAMQERVWGPPYEIDIADALRAHIMRIRKKLGPELGDVKEGAIRTRHKGKYMGVSSLKPITPEAAEAAREGQFAVLADERLILDRDTQSAIRDGLWLHGLSETEFRIMFMLADRVGTPMDRYSISDNVRDLGALSPEAVPVKMALLRRKLGIDDLGHPQKGVIRNSREQGWYVVSSLRDSRDLSTAS